MSAFAEKVYRQAAKGSISAATVTDLYNKGKLTEYEYNKIMEVFQNNQNEGENLG